MKLSCLLANWTLRIKFLIKRRLPVSALVRVILIGRLSVHMRLPAVFRCCSVCVIEIVDRNPATTGMILSAAATEGSLLPLNECSDGVAD